jgi:hypothetical protein
LRRAALLAALAFTLAACAGKAPSPDARRLELSVSPPAPAALPSGTVVSVTARVLPEARMAWVSGTVKILGAPTLPMKLDADGKTWRFKTMVPPMVRVPAGKYEVRAWGRTLEGEAIEGAMSYEVK